MASYWRIRSGITQGDAPLCTEANLALALCAYDGVESVDFETIWAQGHTEAEDSGDADENFIAWVQDCVTDYTTGIESLTPNASPNGEGSGYYNLNGQRVSKPSKGLYILNGKKVVVK